jgi:hypothetical protein
LTVKKQQLFDSLAAGRITQADFDDFYANLNSEQSALEAELAGNNSLDANIIVGYLSYLCWNPSKPMD